MRKKNITPEPEPTYEVEFIRKARTTEDYVWEYYIKWGGYSEKENSWEPEENLTGCRRLLKSFWDQMGPKMKSHAHLLPVGHEVRPSDVWIEKEREAYRKSSEKKKAAQHRKNAEKKKNTGAKGDEDEDEDEDDEYEEDDDEEDDDDEPEIVEIRKDTSKDKMSKRSKPVDRQEGEYSDPDDIPLSMRVKSPINKQGMHKPRTSEPVKQSGALKRKRTIETNSRRSSLERLTKRLKILSRPESHASASAMPSKNEAKKSTISDSSSLFGDESASSDSDDTPLASKPKSTGETPTQTQKLNPNASTGQVPRVPTHVQRKFNPQIKPMPMPIVTTGPQGISTKARLTAMAAGMQPSPTTSASPTWVTRSPIVEMNATQKVDAEKWLKENISQSVTPELHFSKRWRWTGQLAVGDQGSDALAEAIGEVLITDNTPLDTGVSSLEIKQLLNAGYESICLPHMYALSTLPTVLLDFKISQYARMTAERSMVSASEENAVDDLIAYMTKNEIYSQAPLTIADQYAATMFVLPASLEYIWDCMGIPAKIREPRGLFVAIGIQVYDSPKGGLGGRVEKYNSGWMSDLPADRSIEVVNHSLPCSRAMLSLGFSDALFQHIAQKECALFVTPADEALPGPDTIALQTILDNAPGCKKVSFRTGSARYIFIHVSAWSILYKLVGLVDRRFRRGDVQFYTYGSDPSVDKRFWGIREVFCLGGVVTFTPRAIAENPQGTEKLIRKLAEHPLWACYVIPTVVASIIDVYNSTDQSNANLKGVIDALCSILVPIEKGLLDITWEMPSLQSWHHDKPPDSDRPPEAIDLEPKAIDWMIDQAHLSELKGFELVEECRKRFMQSTDRTEKDVEGSIMKDMTAMQSEFRETFRRFVIITDSTNPSNTSKEVAVSVTSSKADVKDMFEFAHVEDFTFGDDYPFSDD